MYVLVFWAETKETSIEEKKNVKYLKNGDVKVLYGGRYQKAKVIKESDSREWLDTLRVSTEGKIDNSAVTPRINTDRPDEDTSEADTEAATDMDECTRKVKRRNIVTKRTNDTQKGKASKADETARLKSIEIAAKERDIEIFKIRKNFANEGAPSTNAHPHYNVKKTASRSCFPKEKTNNIIRKKKIVGMGADRKIALKRTGSADPCSLGSSIGDVEIASSANTHDAAHCDVDETPSRSCYLNDKRIDIARRKKCVGIEADNQIASKRTASADSCSLGSSIGDVELVNKEKAAALFLGKRKRKFKRIFYLNSDSESDIETKKKKINVNNDVELSDHCEHQFTDMRDDETSIQGISDEEIIKSGTQDNHSDPESDTNDKKEDFLESPFLEMLAKQLPPLTANTVIYVKALGTLLETIYEEMAMKNARSNDKSEISGLTKSANLMEMAQIGGSSKIELQLNSGIFVDKLELAHVLEHKDKPRDMVRKLMRLIVGDAELQGMSATGRGARPGIPQKIRSVVGRFVRKNSAPGSEQLDSAAYKRTLNLMCSTLRAQSKKEKNK